MPRLLVLCLALLCGLASAANSTLPESQWPGYYGLNSSTPWFHPYPTYKSAPQLLSATIYASSDAYAGFVLDADGYAFASLDNELIIWSPVSGNFSRAINLGDLGYGYPASPQLSRSGDRLFYWTPNSQPRCGILVFNATILRSLAFPSDSPNITIIPSNTSTELTDPIAFAAYLWNFTDPEMDCGRFEGWVFNALSDDSIVFASQDRYMGRIAANGTVLWFGPAFNVPVFNFDAASFDGVQTPPLPTPDESLLYFLRSDGLFMKINAVDGRVQNWVALNSTFTWTDYYWTADPAFENFFMMSYDFSIGGRFIQHVTANMTLGKRVNLPDVYQSHKVPSVLFLDSNTSVIFESYKGIHILYLPLFFEPVVPGVPDRFPIVSTVNFTDPDGLHTLGALYQPPVYNPNTKVIYIADQNGVVWAVSMTTQSVLWALELRDSVGFQGGIAVGRDGRIFLLDYGAHAYVLGCRAGDGVRDGVCGACANGTLPHAQLCACPAGQGYLLSNYSCAVCPYGLNNVTGFCIISNATTAPNNGTASPSNGTAAPGNGTAPGAAVAPGGTTSPNNATAPRAGAPLPSSAPGAGNQPTNGTSTPVSATPVGVDGLGAARAVSSSSSALLVGAALTVLFVSLLFV